MKPNLLATNLEGVFADVFEDATGTLLVVNPGREAVEAIVETGSNIDDRLTLRVLATRDVLRDVFDDFLVASRAADLLESDRLELRTADDLPRASLVAADDRVVALVSAGDRVGGLVSTDGEFVAAAADAYGADWDDADAFALRTPSMSRVRETLSGDISPDVEGDFEAVLASLETARGDGDGLDEVTISLLVAAKNAVLLYDISKWGEDVGIASKATFSRTKTRLEDLGLIDTEKVPIDVGRPRLRLRLADERLRNADPAELANVACSVLAS